MTTSYYEETVVAWRLAATLGIVTVLLVGAFLHQTILGDLAVQSSRGAFFLGMSALFAAITLNFSRLRIRASDAGLTLAYGIFGSTIAWDRITACSADDTSVVRYGGWGIRVTKVGGEWRLVYNTIGEPRVVVTLTDGRFGEVAFSTRHPEKVIGVIADHATGENH